MIGMRRLRSLWLTPGLNVLWKAHIRRQQLTTSLYHFTSSGAARWQPMPSKSFGNEKEFRLRWKICTIIPQHTYRSNSCTIESPEDDSSRNGVCRAVQSSKDLEPSQMFPHKGQELTILPAHCEFLCLKDSFNNQVLDIRSATHDVECVFISVKYSVLNTFLLPVRRNAIVSPGSIIRIFERFNSSSNAVFAHCPHTILD